MAAEKGTEKLMSENALNYFHAMKIEKIAVKPEVFIMSAMMRERGAKLEKMKAAHPKVWKSIVQGHRDLYSSEKKPNCSRCVYKKNVPGNSHIRCTHSHPHEINVHGDIHGMQNGWFIFPILFDPTWLLSCDGYSPKEEE